MAINKKLNIAQILSTDWGDSEKVNVNAWVRSVRVGKNVTFIAMNDGSCMASLQVVVEPGCQGYEKIDTIFTGASVAVEGKVVSSPAKGQRWELLAESLEVVGSADDTYPLQKKRHSFEFLRTIAHIRPRSNTFGAVFRLRSKLSFAVHTFFQSKDFIYLHSPIITANDCEGAGEMFQITSQEPSGERKEDFFRQKTGLTVSGQLEGEIFASAFSDIYTFGPTFRAENSNTSRHASEFWMVEPEMAFANLDDDCELAWEFISFLCSFILENCMEDMLFFDKFIEKGVIKRIEGLAEGSFEKMSYAEAIERLEKSNKKFEFPVEWGGDLQSEHERYLTEEVTKRPTFVVDYPASLKAFYMRMNDDNRTVAAMDLLVPGVGEIMGGSQREERLDVLKRRMVENGISPEDLWWYLDLRKWGSCPHAGFGMGFDRFIMYVSGMKNIRDVIPFPRTPGHAEF